MYWVCVEMPRLSTSFLDDDFSIENIDPISGRRSKSAGYEYDDSLAGSLPLSSYDDADDDRGEFILSSELEKLKLFKEKDQDNYNVDGEGYSSMMDIEDRRKLIYSLERDTKALSDLLKQGQVRDGA